MSTLRGVCICQSPIGNPSSQMKMPERVTDTAFCFLPRHQRHCLCLIVGETGIHGTGTKWLLPFLPLSPCPVLSSPSPGPALEAFTLLSRLQVAGWFAIPPAMHLHRCQTFPCLSPPGFCSCHVCISQGPADASDPAKQQLLLGWHCSKGIPSPAISSAREPCVVLFVRFMNAPKLQFLNFPGCLGTSGCKHFRGF